MGVMVHCFKTCLCIIICVVFCFISGCATTIFGDIKPRNEDITELQTQDRLSNQNGLIEKAKALSMSNPWSSMIEGYRIEYLSDGLKVVGFLLKPKEGEFHPAIIYNRGGNREFGKISADTLNYLSYLCANGYVILASQYRGNDGGEGREEFGGSDVNDVLNLIATARTLPFVDPERIVMLGFSRGGMMTYIAIKQGADIRAAAVVGGITDLKKLYNEREEGMKNVIEELVGNNRTEWENRSAVYWPEKIDVPVLILHGDADSRVNVSHAELLADKLRKAEKKHELVVYRNGDHGLIRYRKDRDYRILDWFARHTK